jgi:hypothetical protein
MRGRTEAQLKTLQNTSKWTEEITSDRTDARLHSGAHTHACTRYVETLIYCLHEPASRFD